MDMTQFNYIQDPIARAEAMRAQAVAEMLLDAAALLGKPIKAAWAKLVAYMHYRRTYDALSAMTARELDDIGISRADISAVARGFDPRLKAAAIEGDALAQRLALAQVFEQEQEAAPSAATNNDGHRAVAA